MSITVICIHYVASDLVFCLCKLISFYTPAFITYFHQISLFIVLKLSEYFHLYSFSSFLICTIFHILTYLIPVCSSKPNSGATVSMKPFLTIVAPSELLISLQNERRIQWHWHHWGWIISSLQLTSWTLP